MTPTRTPTITPTNTRVPTFTSEYTYTCPVPPNLAYQPSASNPSFKGVQFQGLCSPTPVTKTGFTTDDFARSTRGSIYCYFNGVASCVIKKDDQIMTTNVFYVIFNGDATQTKYYGRLLANVYYYFVTGGKYWPV
jgi:hypothetical protein